MYRLDRLPEEGELVLFKANEIYNDVVRGELIEYNNVIGILPINEVSNKRISNIREVIKEDKVYVGLVLEVDKNNRIVIISLRKVEEGKKKMKISEYKKEVSAYNILKIISEKEGIDLKELEKEILNKIIEKNEKLYNVFLSSVIEGFDVLKKYGIKEKYISLLKKYLKEYINPPKYVKRYNLEAYSLEGDGINKLKEFLIGIKELGFNISYLGAPNYRISFESYDPKILQKKEKELKNYLEEKSKELKIIYSLNEIK